MPDNDLGIPVTGRGEDSMATATVDTVLDQAFADNHAARMHAGRRLTETNDNVSEQTKLGFLEEKKVVGTREAAAMQRMDTDRIALSILQQRATSNQPPPPK
ncbi:hypothetical protein LCGC14_2828980 [marine sediment metagenome]|uniref:Uncharacterized protein n=1 Tax=marine sediment metagenome TaxID=412755 RepID=A0A0F9AN69_9ZZZZ